MIFKYLFIINSDWFVMLAGLKERERESCDILPCWSYPGWLGPDWRSWSLGSPVPSQSEGKPRAELSGQSAVSLKRKIWRETKIVIIIVTVTPVTPVSQCQCDTHS